LCAAAAGKHKGTRTELRFKWKINIGLDRGERTPDQERKRSTRREQAADVQGGGREREERDANGEVRRSERDRLSLYSILG
jgi:hypothetical protein